MLIEVSQNLDTIQSHILLTEENGFIKKEVAGDKLDFSGICYDQSPKHFWIVSDKAQILFLYDWERNKVIESFPLGYSTKSGYQQIKNVEGVAIEPGSNQLFVVSEKEARLYVFGVRE